MLALNWRLLLWLQLMIIMLLISLPIIWFVECLKTVFQMSSNVYLFCPKPKDIQVTLIQEDNYHIEEDGTSKCFACLLRN